ncbi:cobalt/nickel transport system ATP-binding protein [Rhizobium sp. SG_E_25_P2]|uniref:energy-coupling factor ABC transporter ATP-binding protein n=1 Tax=Rhizobium sp. SG_E_25_P2 TaxID=2879942 RepID=UPI0024739996|nr:ATP-binding cassette domain-containing protein [Rhizobium sp. SG_E_25_P2]MDH6269556.1 cobalt/nickel transport system ATP-binding protein [Rhizobium sp. SG_E_25_P2]
MMLEARDVEYRYEDESQALQRASLAIRAREKLAILGPNGARKSTLLSLLNGSFKPFAGEVLLHGAPVTYSRKGLTVLRSAVGLVLQDPDDQLFAATVFEDVSFGPLNLGLSTADARMRVTHALEVMGIEELSHRPTHLLSFGQRKRVAIAGVLAMSPSVLLLDEPTAGLDPQGVEELAATLHTLAGQGVAVVVATHDIDMAYAWAERVAVFGGGKIPMDGTPDEVFSHEGFSACGGLRMPTIHQVSKGLMELGLMSAQDGLPRSVADLLRCVRTVRDRG